MIKIAVCDDQVDIIEKITEYISMYQFHCEYDVDTFLSGKELLQSDKHFDLIFLDVEMPEQDGIQTAKDLRIRDKNVSFIYVTNYSEYAISTFSVHPFDFVLKPINSKKILKVIDDYVEYKKKSDVTALIELKGVTRDVVMNIHDIIYFEYFDNRRMHVITNRSTFDIKGSLSDFIEKTAEYGFYSPHKSFLVNFEYINTIEKGYIHMSNGEDVPIAQKKYNELKQLLYKYFHRSI